MRVGGTLKKMYGYSNLNAGFCQLIISDLGKVCFFYSKVKRNVFKLIKQVKIINKIFLDGKFCTSIMAITELVC